MIVSVARPSSAEDFVPNIGLLRYGDLTALLSELAGAIRGCRSCGVYFLPDHGADDPVLTRQLRVTQKSKRLHSVREARRQFADRTRDAL
jgi:hypothetical protein